MKLLLFLFGIVLCYGLPSLGGYQSIDTVDAQSNTKIKGLVDIGLQQIITDGVQNGNFTSTNFVITKINSIFRLIDNGNENYKFNCQFDNDEDVTVVANFEVQTSVSATSSSTVTSFSYQMTKRTVIQTVDSSYKELSSTEIQYSQEVQDAVNYGVAQVIEKSVQEGSLPNLTFQIQQVNSVLRQIVDSSLFYKCNVNLQAEVNVTVEVTFTVFHQPISASSSMVDYSCKVKDQELIESEFTVTTEIIGPAEDQYTPLAVGDMQTDSQIKNVMQYGCEQVNKIAVEEKRIPVVKLEIQAVLEAYSQVVGNGLFYKFTCKLGDGKGVSVIATFTVHYQTTTNEKSLTQCSYETEHDSTEEDNGESEVEMGNVEFGNIDGGLPDDIDIDIDVESEVDLEVPELSEDNIEQEILLNSIMQFGIDIIIKQGIKDEKIPKDKYPSSNLISSSQDSTDKGTLYTLECEVTNENKTSVINMNFTVYYQFSSGRKTMSSYSYTINTADTTETETPTKPIDGEYTVCGEEEVQNDTVIQTVLNYGASQIYMIGLLKGQLSVSEFSIVSVVNVWRQVTVNGGNYKCEVVMENQYNVTVNASFMVSYQTSTNQTALSEYDYTINESVVPDDVETEIDTNTNTTTNSTDDYVELTTSEIESDAEAQHILSFATEFIIEKGYNASKIPVSDYKITKIVSFTRKVQDNGINFYKGSIQLKDDKQVLVKARFTISIRSSTQKKFVYFWNYHVSNIRTSSSSSSGTKPVDTAYTEINKTEAEYSSEIQSCLSFAVQEVIQQYEQYTSTVINSVYRQVVESSLYYKFNVELSNDQGKTLNLACTVSYKPEIDLKTVKAYSYKIKTVSTSTSTSTQTSNSYSYTQIETSQVTTDSKYQGILDYGVKECVQKLSDYKVVLTTDFQVSEVLSAFTQSTTEGENCKFKARLTSSKGVYLDVNINVNYNANTDTKVLTSYSVEGSSEGVSDVLVVDSPKDNNDDLEVGSCKKVASEEVDVDTEVQGAINYGLDSIVGEIVTNENIETNDFEVKQVKNVYREVVNSQNYRVEATLENSQGKNIDCSFSVNYQSSLNVKQVVSYSYITY